jgi:large subunit ribosomal protein L4
MFSARFFSASGEPGEAWQLPQDLFDGVINDAVLHQVIKAYLANQRQGNASTKSRGEVRGGARKVWRQKGTGRARQGSIRAPHYRHGGVAHGPTPRAYTKEMPQKMRRAAFRSALSAKAAGGSLRVVEALEVPEISTKQFAEWLGRLEPGRKAILVLSERNDNVWLSARNIPDLQIRMLPGLSTYEVMRADTLIFTQDAVTRLEELYTS